MKDKQWKDYWDLDLGCSYIPVEKLNSQVNMADLEEGGMFDDETLPDWMRTMKGSSVGGPYPVQEPVMAPPHMSLAQPHELITRMPPIEGLAPPFAPPGLGLLPPPGAPLGPNLLIRPGGFPATGTQLEGCEDLNTRLQNLAEGPNNYYNTTITQNSPVT